MTVFTRATAAAVLLVVSGGCHAGAERSATAGPVNFAALPGEVCLKERTGRDLTLGQGTLEIRGGVDQQDVRLVEVSLPDATNLVVVDASIVEVGNISVGSYSTWPPSREVTSAEGVRWGERQTLPANLPEASSTVEAIVVVAHVRQSEDDAPATTDGMTLEYEYAGSRYVAQSQLRLRIAATC